MDKFLGNLIMALKLESSMDMIGHYMERLATSLGFEVKARDDDQSRPSVKALFGLLLIGASVVGIALYVGSRTPRAVSLCLLVLASGVALLGADLKVGDAVLFGISPADVTVWVVKTYQSSWARFALLASVPDLGPRDVEVVSHHLPAPALESSTSSVGSCISGTCLVRADPFDVAVRWLEQPRLQLSLGEQLQLRSIYLQATSGDCGPVPGHRISSLERAQRSAWQELRGVPRQAARRRLVPALAEVDPAFAVGNPTLMPPQASSRSLLITWLSLLELRMPANFEEGVRRLQFGLSAASGLAAVLAAYALQRLARHPKATKRVIWARRMAGGSAIIGQLLSLYFLSLAKGLPAWAHLLALRCMGGPQVHALVPNSVQFPADRLRKRLVRCLVPGVSQSLFAMAVAASKEKERS